jgi:hypothetical protein
MRMAPVSLAYSRGRSGRVLGQQGHETDEQRATEHHGPVPDVEIEKPAVGRYKSELHARPLPKTTRRRRYHRSDVLLPGGNDR